MADDEQQKMWDPLRDQVLAFMEQQPKRMNKTQLAARLGVTQPAITQFLGKRRSGPSLALLAGLARLLNTSMEALLPDQMLQALPVSERPGQDDEGRGRDSISTASVRDRGLTSTERDARERLIRIAEDIFIAVNRPAAKSGRQTDAAAGGKSKRTRGRGKPD